MEYEIKRIPIAPVAKVAFFVFLVVGFIGGLFYGMLMMNLISMMSGVIDAGDELLQEFSGLGMAGIIMTGMMMAIFSSVIMTALTAVGIASYNVFAGWLGGIKLNLVSPELEDVLYEEVDADE
ncbi:MAG: DUF3566 domain-containing protein [FCB group bacterium]|nr:DUF3566 domain-containing protein [FCB group bacterium]